MRVGDVAQLGERLVCNQEVEGSIPFVSTPKSSNNKDLGRQLSTNELKDCTKTALKLAIWR